MNEQAKLFVREIEPHSQTNQIFDVLKQVKLCTLDLICETAMGKTVNAMGERDSEYVKAISRTTTLLQHRMWSPWLWWDPLYYSTDRGRESAKHLATLHGFTRKVIGARIEKLNENGMPGSKKKRKAFLDMLFSSYADGNLSLEGICEEVDTFMFEGHDTISSALGWTFQLIGQHPDVQSKLYQKIDDIFDNKEGSDTLTMEDVKNMEYLELVIKESMRLFPPVPIIGRKISRECSIDGHHLPIGTEVLLFKQVIHRDPKYWEDPDKFNPERFTTDNSEGRHPFSYIPFSAGPRNCIGQRFAMMELKVVLAHFLRNFNITSCQCTAEIQQCTFVINDASTRITRGVDRKPGLAVV